MLQQDLKQCESRSASLGHGAKTAINCWYCCLDVLNWFKVKMLKTVWKILRSSPDSCKILQTKKTQVIESSFTNFTRWCMRTCYSSRCSEQLRCQTRTRVMQPGSRRHWGVWHQYHIASHSITTSSQSHLAKRRSYDVIPDAKLANLN